MSSLLLNLNRRELLQSAEQQVGVRGGRREKGLRRRSRLQTRQQPAGMGGGAAALPVAPCVLPSSECQRGGSGADKLYEWAVRRRTEWLDLVDNECYIDTYGGGGEQQVKRRAAEAPGGVQIILYALRVFAYASNIYKYRYVIVLGQYLYRFVVRKHVESPASHTHRLCVVRSRDALNQSVRADDTPIDA